MRNPFHHRLLLAALAAIVLAFSATAAEIQPAPDPAEILELAGKGDPMSLALYLDLRRMRAEAGAGPNETFLPSPADPAQKELIDQLERLADLVETANRFSGSVLGNPELSRDEFVDLRQSARKASHPEPELSRAAAGMIGSARVAAESLLELRVTLLERLQREMRRGVDNPGTRIAWGIVRAAVGDPGTSLEPYSLRYSRDRVEARLEVAGVPFHILMTAGDYQKRIRVAANGYSFTCGWALLFQKPFRWVAAVAADMRKAGVDPARYPEWDLMEGGGGLMAMTPDRSGEGRTGFFRGTLAKLEELPRPEGVDRLDDDFLAAAKRLHETVTAANSVSRQLRQALNPVLMGTYLPIDKRDYFDASFCRRLIEANYLETFISPLPPEIASALADYRRTLDKLEAGYDRFIMNLPDGGRLIAIANPAIGAEGAVPTDDQDMETGETLPPYAWRLEKGDETVFYSPLPARSIYSLGLAEYYHGRHAQRPKGTPFLAETYHPMLGVLISYREGDPKAMGSPEAWEKALSLDRNGGTDASAGPLGWSFPAHVLVRDDQGDPVLLATPGGVTPTPNFSALDDPEARRRAEDKWLDEAAKVLATPGELGLIYHQFFRYCSDSPLPELPNLIGSHYGLSDTHQTVYQSLERRWVGRLIGDCDDLAEFFQVLTRRQGKLSHVMQLPAHAACGYVERTGDDGYRFILLQTGPVLQFNAHTLADVVEAAYTSFDDEGGRSHFSPAAVPILLRFADEDTRTPFVLSARIYEDAEYAEAMIRVQGYWHLNAYSAAVREMEEMIKTDREIGNLKELGSLYQRVGMYEESARLRREELDEVDPADIQTRMSTLLDIAQLHMQDKDRAATLAALREMKEEFEAMPDGSGSDDPFFRVMAFRYFWAVLMAKEGYADEAWDVLKRDVRTFKELSGRVSEQLLRTMVAVFDSAARDRDRPTKASDEAGDPKGGLAGEIETALAKGFFKSDDAYTTIIRRYQILGMYAVAMEGRAAGFRRLLRDGPYPAAPKDHTQRGRAITDEDWQWFRIIPSLYLSYAVDMLDRDEFPDLYDPAGARPLLAAVGRAVDKGEGLGSDVAGSDDAVKAMLVLSFVDNDLEAFRRVMAEVLARNYASLYDDAAITFGTYCGLVPLAEFPAWVESFHQFFPGRQHYFKVAYRAMDKGYYDHALAMAEATAGYFPDDELLVQEAAFVKRMTPDWKAKAAEREARQEQERREKPDGEAKDVAENNQAG